MLQRHHHQEHLVVVINRWYKYMSEIKREEVPDGNSVKMIITYMCTVKGCLTTTDIRIQEGKEITNELNRHFETFQQVS